MKLVRKFNQMRIGYSRWVRPKITNLAEKAATLCEKKAREVKNPFVHAALTGWAEGTRQSIEMNKLNFEMNCQLIKKYQDSLLCDILAARDLLATYPQYLRSCASPGEVDLNAFKRWLERAVAYPDEPEQEPSPEEQVMEVMNNLLRQLRI